MNRIDKELNDIESKIKPLETRRWKLWDAKEKMDNSNFLASGVLAGMVWRVRTYGNDYRAFLQYGGDYKVEAIEKIVPYPHSHRELARGMTLNQDDGDITLTFDNTYLMLKYIKVLNLKIKEWQNLTDIIKHLQQYKRLAKYLESQRE